MGGGIRPRPARSGQLIAETPRRTVRVPNDLWDAAKAHAAADGATLTDVVVQALVDYLPERDRP